MPNVNLLTTNQADGTEAAATTGLVTTGAGATVTSSTTQKFSGARAIKVVCAGSGTGEGVKTTTTAVPIKARPMTFSAKVYASVAVQITITVTSAVASLSLTRTVSVPATTWTEVIVTGSPKVEATDGVLTVKTGETKVVDLYIDELGAWTGVGGAWAPAGSEAIGTAGGNSNVDRYYDGLAPISDLERAAIAAGLTDAQVDWLP
jgi:hypothetical protein